eukprot:COSAG01_NODE_22442_length_855_cov_1.742063_1_plen_81_part_01
MSAEVVRRTAAPLATEAMTQFRMNDTEAKFDVRSTQHTYNTALIPCVSSHRSMLRAASEALHGVHGAGAEERPERSTQGGT